MCNVVALSSVIDLDFGETFALADIDSSGTSAAAWIAIPLLAVGRPTCWQIRLLHAHMLSDTLSARVTDLLIR